MWGSMHDLQVLVLVLKPSATLHCTVMYPFLSWVGVGLWDQNEKRSLDCLSLLFFQSMFPFSTPLTFLALMQFWGSRLKKMFNSRFILFMATLIGWNISEAVWLHQPNGIKLATLPISKRYCCSSFPTTLSRWDYSKEDHLSWREVEDCIFPFCWF